MAKKTEAAKAADLRPITPQKKLRELLASHRAAKNDIDEIAGGLGSEIKTAVEKNHLHRKAFRVVLQADRMEPEKLADFLDNLDHYLEISGLRARAASAPKFEVVGGTDVDEGTAQAAE